MNNLRYLIKLVCFININCLNNKTTAAAQRIIKTLKP